MNILIINQDWFAEELRQLGHRVITCGLSGGYDINLPTVLLNLDTVLKMCPGDFVPDRIIYLDNSSPITLTGFDEVTIPTLFYAVDTHHHLDLHKYLGLLFDKILIAQRDYMEPMAQRGGEVAWMPLWSSRFFEPSDNKQFDVTFVGTLNAKLNPDRVRFFDELRTLVPVHCQMGQFWEIFPASRIVMNQTVKSDLNFRVFEGLMSGSLLLTEDCGNGFHDLFEEGVHLITYQRGNAAEAAEKIKYYLAHEAKARAIGLQGRAEVVRKHTAMHRAKELLEHLEPLQKQYRRGRHFASVINFSSLSLRLLDLDAGAANRAILAAMKAADYALKEGEQPDDEIIWHLCRAALMYDRQLGSTAGATFLDELEYHHPHYSLVTVCRLRNRLNSGDVQGARGIARAFVGVEFEDIAQRAEEAVRNLIPPLGACDIG